eukprot:c1370_g1_i1.p1 GENE.c1370_g1_i1~~c1370_g1_i1.p1  ORF type:complete len:552 (+),score=105.39 c1370_g1_i1:168-1658(+)
MAEGKPPYFDVHPMRAIFLIPSRRPPTLKEQTKWSDDFHDFLSLCLTKVVAQRPFAKDLLNHPFLTKNLKKGRRSMRELAIQYLTKTAEAEGLPVPDFGTLPDESDDEPEIPAPEAAVPTAEPPVTEESIQTPIDPPAEPEAPPDLAPPPPPTPSDSPDQESQQSPYLGRSATKTTSRTATRFSFLSRGRPSVDIPAPPSSAPPSVSRGVDRIERADTIKKPIRESTLSRTRPSPEPKPKGTTVATNPTPRGAAVAASIRRPSSQSPPIPPAPKPSKPTASSVGMANFMRSKSQHVTPTKVSLLENGAKDARRKDDILKGGRLSFDDGRSRPRARDAQWVNDLWGAIEEIENGMSTVKKKIPSASTHPIQPVAPPVYSSRDNLLAPAAFPVYDPYRKSPVSQMAESMMMAMKIEDDVQVTRGVTVYDKEFSNDTILGEVVITPSTTVDEMVKMIETELGVKPGFQIKKKNIPIAKTQRAHKAMGFFRSNDDYAVIV